MGIGEVVQQTVRIGDVTEFDIFTVEFTDAVAVGIFDAGVVQDLLGAFRIVFIGILQLVKAHTQRAGDNGWTGSVQTADGVGFADGLIIDGLMNSLTQRLVSQGLAFLHVHPAETATGACRNLNREFLVSLQGLQVRNVHDVFSQVDLTGAQRISLGGSIAHEQDVNGLIRSLAIPVMGIGNQFIAYMILEALNHVRAGSDNAGFRVFGACVIQDAHCGVGQACRHIGIGFFGFNGDGAGFIVSCYDSLGIQELGGVGGTLGAFFTYPVKGFLNLGSRHFNAVTELDTLFQFESPGLVAVAGSSGFCQLRNGFYVVIKFEQCLADAKAAYIPGGVGLEGRIDQTVGIHLAAKVQYFNSTLAAVFRSILLVTAAATGQQATGNETCYQ